ncbi:S10 family peptidase [Roseivirga sp.]|uniref:S10 family peptidase n=1 Tax=Roseivirga sp. TaxID=1964215 RepID=UPI002B26FAD9|nr:peptidase S10 [Roseivirga sp.]
MKRFKSTYLILTYLLCSTFNFYGQEQKSPEIPEPKKFTTEHEGIFGGKKIAYTATGSEMQLTNSKNEPTGSMWSVAYTKSGSIEQSTRPVTFVFNGGPGSASMWLHMGFFGPKVVRVDSDAVEDDGGAPYPIEENKFGLLDITDLVFIDPIGTGYSQMIGNGKGDEYWGLNQDAQSVATFIRQWVTENNRWMSPKYIAGESFGTTRAAAVSQALEGNGQALALNGLILISQALDYEGSTSIEDNITSYVTYMPTMAATAWYHKKAGQGKTLEAFVEEARDFAYNQYVSALYKGDLISSQEKDAIAQKLAYFYGIDINFIKRANNRVLTGRFKKELLRDQGVALGTLDARYYGDDPDDTADSPELGDASSYKVSAAYTAALNHYFTNDLQITMDRPYLSSGRLSGWDWGSGGEPMYVKTSRRLANAMRRNEGMKVLVACGYYDMITPFFDAEFTFSRNAIPMDRVKLTYYEGGHMMYNHQPDFEKLAKDIRAFITEK